jgi:hypothetical protein
MNTIRPIDKLAGIVAAITLGVKMYQYTSDLVLTFAITIYLVVILQ